MNSARHEKILDIIKEKDIFTQDGILEELSNSGYEVTQATISRDIKKLGLIKILTSQGKYKYTTHDLGIKPNVKSKIRSIFAESVISIDYALNTVVLKCHVGMANAACAAFDLMEWDGVVGTLAGDDTIFILMRTEEKCELFSKELLKLIDE